MTKPTNRIAGIDVRGFKSINAEQHLDIRPLTILAGANSSGKSSIMQPLLLLKQTLEAPGDPGALLLDGPNVRFTRTDQVLNHAPGRHQKAEFALRIALLENMSLELVFRREEGSGFKLGTMTYRTGQETTVVTPEMSHEEGDTTVTLADLDDNGAYGDWPEDFDKTELQAEREYLDIVEAKAAKKGP